MAAPAETQELGLGSGYVFEERGSRLVPGGINVIDGTRVDEGELDEEMLVIDREEVAVNINPREDLAMAERP